jgi:hypothetical protein
MVSSVTTVGMGWLVWFMVFNATLFQLQVDGLLGLQWCKY